ncbi:hypothetical protein MMC34_008003 [Xylographa carneopallida]|nr:hypothetical protein [Xylographa carneopallida]
MKLTTSTLLATLPALTALMAPTSAAPLHAPSPALEKKNAIPKDVFPHHHHLDSIAERYAAPEASDAEAQVVSVRDVSVQLEARDHGGQTSPYCAVM